MGKGILASLSFLAFRQGCLARRMCALFRSREGAFLVAESFLHGFSSMEKHCSYIQVLISPLCGESRRVAGLFGTPPFFRWVYFVGRFSPWFQLYGEALLIHFIQFYLPLCGKVPGGREFFRDPLLFLRGYVVKRFSPWFQLHGEALLIHFILSPAAAGPLGWELRGSSFFIRGFSRFGEKFCIEDFLCYNRKVEIS